MGLPSCLVLCIFISFYAGVHCFPTTYTLLYFSGNSSYSLVPGEIQQPETIAWATYVNDINSTGWSTFSVNTSTSFPDDRLAYAAGYLEGALTYVEIGLYLETFNEANAGFQNGSKLYEELLEWVHSWNTYINLQIESNPNDEYWIQVSLILSQLQGLTDGFNLMTTNYTQRKSLFDFLFFNSGADTMDVLQSLMGESQRTKWTDFTPDEAYFLSSVDTHCSALIRFLSDDVLIGHTTWNQYLGMLRIYKSYTLNFNSVSTHQISFSSYPAFLFSGDDFYILQNGLVVLETTLNIFNTTLYDLLTPKSVLTWMRGMVANRLANSSKDWVNIFSKYNSGTYNNQWMVVDLNKINSFSDWFYILEQIPGSVKIGDLSRKIESEGYFPSYNIPLFEEIFYSAGYGSMVQQFGNVYSYEKCPRANIFRRDAGKIYEIKSMQKMMQYNDFEHDPLSLGNPSYSVSSRFDLLPGNQSYPMGGTDSKVTSLKLARDMTAVAISGPTRESLPAFSWKTNPWETPHLGQPETFDFSWVTMHL